MPVFDAGARNGTSPLCPNRRLINKAEAIIPRFVDRRSVLEKYPEICHADN